MNKTIFFSFIFLIICGLAWAEPTEMEIYFGDLQDIPEIQPIDFCFKISNSQGEGFRELMFGTCVNPEQNKINTPLPYGNPDDIYDSGFDYYFADQAVENRYYNVFFTENDQEAEWFFVVRKPCALTFTLLSDFAPKQGSFLEFYQDETKLGDIVDGCTIEFNAHGQYTIKYVPAPEKSTVEAEVTYTFQPGWNLLHLPIIVYADQRREDVENDNWDTLLNLSRMTLSGRTYVKGGDIHCGEAFWVFYKDGDIEGNTLTVYGYEPLETDWPARRNGWNFTGEKKNTNEVPANTYGWTAGRYQAPVSIDSSKGYWINKTP